jgi:hypothetical protein
MYNPPSTDNSALVCSAATELPAQPGVKEMSLPQRAELVRRLLGAMMLAQAFEMCTTARTIYDAVTLLVDDIDQVRLCLAFSSAVGGNMAYANALRDAGFSGSDNEDRKHLTLAFVLSLSKDTDDSDSNWRSVPESLLRTSSDPNILRTARLMLDR